MAERQGLQGALGGGSQNELVRRDLGLRDRRSDQIDLKPAGAHTPWTYVQNEIDCKLGFFVKCSSNPGRYLRALNWNEFIFTECKFWSSV